MSTMANTFPSVLKTLLSLPDDAQTLRDSMLVRALSLGATYYSKPPKEEVANPVKLLTGKRWFHANGVFGDLKVVYNVLVALAAGDWNLNSEHFVTTLGFLHGVLDKAPVASPKRRSPSPPRQADPLSRVIARSNVSSEIVKMRIAERMIGNVVEPERAPSPDSLPVADNAEELDDEDAATSAFKIVRVFIEKVAEVGPQLTATLEAGELSYDTHNKTYGKAKSSLDDVFNAYVTVHQSDPTNEKTDSRNLVYFPVQAALRAVRVAYETPALHRSINFVLACLHALFDAISTALVAPYVDWDVSGSLLFENVCQEAARYIFNPIGKIDVELYAICYHYGFDYGGAQGPHQVFDCLSLPIHRAELNFSEDDDTLIEVESRQIPFSKEIVVKAISKLYSPYRSIWLEMRRPSNVADDEAYDIYAFLKSLGIDSNLELPAHLQLQPSTAEMLHHYAPVIRQYSINRLSNERFEFTVPSHSWHMHSSSLISARDYGDLVASMRLVTSDHADKGTVEAYQTLIDRVRVEVTTAKLEAAHQLVKDSPEYRLAASRIRNLALVPQLYRLLEDEQYTLLAHGILHEFELTFGRPFRDELPRYDDARGVSYSEALVAILSLYTSDRPAARIQLRHFSLALRAAAYQVVLAPVAPYMNLLLGFFLSNHSTAPRCDAMMREFLSFEVYTSSTDDYDLPPLWRFVMVESGQLMSAMSAADFSRNFYSRRGDWLRSQLILFLHSRVRVDKLIAKFEALKGIQLTEERRESYRGFYRQVVMIARDPRRKFVSSHAASVVVDSELRYTREAVLSWYTMWDAVFADYGPLWTVWREQWTKWEQSEVKSRVAFKTVLDQPFSNALLGERLLRCRDPELSRTQLYTQSKVSPIPPAAEDPVFGGDDLDDKALAFSMYVMRYKAYTSLNRFKPSTEKEPGKRVYVQDKPFRRYVVDVSPSLYVFTPDLRRRVTTSAVLRAMLPPEDLYKSNQTLKIMRDSLRLALPHRVDTEDAATALEAALETPFYTESLRLLNRFDVIVRSLCAAEPARSAVRYDDWEGISCLRDLNAERLQKNNLMLSTDTLTLQGAVRAEAWLVLSQAATHSTTPPRLTDFSRLLFQIATLMTQFNWYYTMRFEDAFLVSPLEAKPRWQLFRPLNLSPLHSFTASTSQVVVSLSGRRHLSTVWSLDRLFGNTESAADAQSHFVAILALPLDRNLLVSHAPFLEKDAIRKRAVSAKRLAEWKVNVKVRQITPEQRAELLRKIASAESREPDLMALSDEHREIMVDEFNIDQRMLLKQIFYAANPGQLLKSVPDSARLIRNARAYLDSDRVSSQDVLDLLGLFGKTYPPDYDITQDAARRASILWQHIIPKSAAKVGNVPPKFKPWKEFGQCWNALDGSLTQYFQDPLFFMYIVYRLFQNANMQTDVGAACRRIIERVQHAIEPADAPSDVSLEERKQEEDEEADLPAYGPDRIATLAEPKEDEAELHARQERRFHARPLSDDEEDPDIVAQRVSVQQERMPRLGSPRRVPREEPPSDDNESRSPPKKPRRQAAIIRKELRIDRPPDLDLGEDFDANAGDSESDLSRPSTPDRPPSPPLPPLPLPPDYSVSEDPILRGERYVDGFYYPVYQLMRTAFEVAFPESALRNDTLEPRLEQLANRLLILDREAVKCRLVVFSLISTFYETAPEPKFVGVAADGTVEAENGETRLYRCFDRGLQLYVRAGNDLMHKLHTLVRVIAANDEQLCGTALMNATLIPIPSGNEMLEAIVRAFRTLQCSNRARIYVIIDEIRLLVQHLYYVGRIRFDESVNELLKECDAFGKEVYSIQFDADLWSKMYCPWMDDVVNRLKEVVGFLTGMLSDASPRAFPREAAEDVVVSAPSPPVPNDSDHIILGQAAEAADDAVRDAVSDAAEEMAIRLAAVPAVQDSPVSVEEEEPAVAVKPVAVAGKKRPRMVTQLATSFIHSVPRAPRPISDDDEDVPVQKVAGKKRGRRQAGIVRPTAVKPLAEDVRVADGFAFMDAAPLQPSGKVPREGFMRLPPSREPDLDEPDIVKFGWLNPDTRFRNLSHMAPVRPGISFNNKLYTSVECAYQDTHMTLISEEAADDIRSHLAFLQGGQRSLEAKRLASKKGFADFTHSKGLYPTKAAAEREYAKAQPQWFRMNVHVMAQLDFLKFHVSEDMKRLLLDTGAADLREAVRGNGLWTSAGQNMTGKILMAVRDTLSMRASAEELPALAVVFADEFVHRPSTRQAIQEAAATKMKNKKLVDEALDLSD